MLEPIWTLTKTDEDAVRALATRLGLPEPLAAVLQARGIGDADAYEAFRRAGWGGHTPPDAFAETDRAVERLQRAIRGREPIRVHGDYDVDGVCGTALLVHHLRELGATVDFAIPLRLRDGYGIDAAAVERAARDGVRVIVTVDNGSTAADAHAAARAAGIDVVVCDHHRVDVRPDVTAHLNPHAPGESVPYPHLCGAAVAWKLAVALGSESGAALPLVALATVADVVPLTGENRAIVARGLPALADPRRVGHVGATALFEIAGLAPDAITAGRVAFQIGPRLNAAGRIGDASIGVRLLTTSDRGEAIDLAKKLDEANRERRGVQERVLEQASALADRDARDGRYGLVLAGSDWHPGVLGIAASRIVERFHRPAVLIAHPADGVARGSGRSVRGFDLHAALSACEAHLERFGGHRAAAGLTLRSGALDAFRAAFEAVCAERLRPRDITPTVRCDARLAPGDVDLELAERLGEWAPFGMGNAEPLFAFAGLDGVRDVRVFKQKHVGFRVEAEGRSLDAIAFGAVEHLELLRSGRTVDVAARVRAEAWSGRRRVRLEVRAVRPEGTLESERATAETVS